MQVWAGRDSANRLIRSSSASLLPSFDSRPISPPRILAPQPPLEMAAKRALKDYFAPITANPPTCIVLPPIVATQFEIRPATISMLPSFHGLDR